MTTRRGGGGTSPRRFPRLPLLALALALLVLVAGLTLDFRGCPDGYHRAEPHGQLFDPGRCIGVEDGVVVSL